MYSIQWVQCVVYSVWYTVCEVQCCVQCVVYSVLCTVCEVQCCVQCVIDSVLCTVWTLHNEIASITLLALLARFPDYPMNNWATYCMGIMYTVLYLTTLHQPSMHCIALHLTALHCTALHYTAIHCTPIHCTSLHWTRLHYIPQWFWDQKIGPIWIEPKN